MPNTPRRVMAEQLWKWAGVPGNEKDWLNEITDAIHNHTAYPDCIGALEEAQHALFGDKRQRVDNALAKAKGIEP